MNKFHHLPEPLSVRLLHALGALFTTLDTLSVAIALSEGGDVEGAKALLGTPATRTLFNP